MGVIYNGRVFYPDYLLNSGFFILLALVAYIIYILYVVKTKRFKAMRAVIMFLFFIYIGALIMVTQGPFNIFLPNNPVYHLGFGKQYIFNFSLADMLGDMPFQIFGNIIMLAPFVYFMALLNKKYATYKAAVLIAFLASLSIESMQAILNYFYLESRFFDINDLILNTLGAFTGMTFFKLTNLIFRKSNKTKIESASEQEKR